MTHVIVRVCVVCIEIETTWIKLNALQQKLHNHHQFIIPTTYLLITNSQLHFLIQLKTCGMEGGGTSLSELYQSSKRLLLKTRDGLERLERLEFSSNTASVDSPELSYAVQRDISQIHSLCANMDLLWRSIAAKPQRDLWKRSLSPSL